MEESFLLLKNIYEISDKVYRENLKLFNDIFGLQEFVGRTARKLSLGQRMKADLAAALLHNPSIVFLDEPTIGLDIGTKEAMRELIQRINRERGVTIILTSHDLKDVENICQRIIVIDDGRVVCDKGIHSLAKEYSMDRGLLLTLSETQQGLLEKVRPFFSSSDSFSMSMASRSSLTASAPIPTRKRSPHLS